MASTNPTLDETVLNWLLEEDNPSVRYFTLKDFVGKKDNDPELMAAKAEIPGSKVVAKIFSKQKPEGHWEEPWSPYLPKYKSSYWQIMILALLGMEKSSPKIQIACENIFKFQHDEGGFSYCTVEMALEKYYKLGEKVKELPQNEYASSMIREHQYSCLTGNVGAALIRMGYIDDPRLQKSLEWLIRIQNRDGGWLCPYWRAHVNDTHGCFYGTICPLEAFSEVPEAKRSKAMKETIEKGAEFLLMHRLFKADHHNFAVINQSWLKLGFPRFYGYNVLRGLDVLTKLGYVEDERLDDAVKVVLQKRMPDGRWILESAPTGRMHVNLEPVGKPSKWITLTALRVLKRLYPDKFALATRS